MPHLSRRSIEAIAKRIVDAYKKLPSLQDQQQKQLLHMVQPELLAHELLGLTTEYHSLVKCPNCGENIFFPPGGIAGQKTGDPCFSEGKPDFTYERVPYHYLLKGYVTNDLSGYIGSAQIIFYNS